MLTGEKELPRQSRLCYHVELVGIILAVARNPSPKIMSALGLPMGLREVLEREPSMYLWAHSC
jgi:hypothetical protein